MAFGSELQVLLSRRAIAERVAELGATITRDYQQLGGVSHESPLVLLCVLKGAYVFSADLARSIQLPVRVEFLGVQSYGASTRSSGVVRLTQDISRPIAGEHVLIVEDIVDTGLTLHYLIEQLSIRQPASLRLCTLLHKPSKSEREVPLDYVGFTIDDVFVVGYGLDHAERYRNLADLCVLAE
jgi:hypoxanthine phosphoribosyltransferase